MVKGMNLLEFEDLFAAIQNWVGGVLEPQRGAGQVKSGPQCRAQLTMSYPLDCRQVVGGKMVKR